MATSKYHREIIVFTDTPLLLEESPKWAALKEVLQEIQDHSKDDVNPEKDAPVSGSRPVLVCAADDRSCSQLKEVRYHHITWHQITLCCITLCHVTHH